MTVRVILKTSKFHKKTEWFSKKEEEHESTQK